MILPRMGKQEILSQGVAGKIMSLDPPLVMDDFQLFYPRREGFSSAILDAVKARGVWEPNITKYILDECRPGMQFMDIGAHLGYYSFIVDKACEGTASVYAFEASSEMCSAMSRTASYEHMSNNVNIYNFALSNKTGEKILLRGPENDSGSSTMVIGDVEGPNGQIEDRFKETFSATTLRLDDLGLSNIDLIKMDVEGAEPLVWDGMRETLDRSPGVKIVMETGIYHPQWLRDIWRESFDIYVFDYDGTLATPPPGWIEKIPATDVVLVKK